MSISMREGKVVHYPKNPSKFEFDEEVASLFDSMAKRSIPMYDEAHRMHVSMLQDKFTPGAVVVDVGSSTGRLFWEIEDFHDISLPELQLHCTAIDQSAPMMERLQVRFPYVDTVLASLPNLPALAKKADIIFCLYTMQFVYPSDRYKCMQWFSDNLKPDGVVVFGQKDTTTTLLFSEEYYRMRRANGYTQEEIDAKTRALSGSMWPVDEAARKHEAWSMGFSLKETSRWLDFSTSIAFKVHYV